MATLKLYNPILSEATKECYWFCDEAGTSFKDVDEFINGIPAGDDNIELLLHCDGGEVNEGWAIVDKLRSTGKKITATIEGNCASMATVVLLAASERRAYPHASLLIHKPYYPEYTLADAYRADDLESLAASLRDDEQKMLDFYVERTGRVRDYNDVTIRLSGRYIFICRIGNEKATVYFQPIALEYRISNNLLQDTNIFQNRQIYPKSRCMQKLAF